MNVQEYISSGILEAYVTGGLSAEERADVEQNLSRYPELREELRLIQEAHETLLFQTGIPTPAYIKGRILERINDDPKAVKSNQRTLIFWQFAAAASIALAVVAAYFALDYRSRWQDASRLVLETKSQFESMALKYNTVKHMEEELHVAADPSMKKVVMHGTNNAPEAMATVYWGETSAHVYLKVNKMKSLGANSQYQLWAIIDGKPVDAGVFDATESGMIRMKDIGKGATTFAVTIEKKGGNALPTLTTMQVAGNV